MYFVRDKLILPHVVGENRMEKHVLKDPVPELQGRGRHAGDHVEAGGAFPESRPGGYSGSISAPFVSSPLIIRVTRLYRLCES